MSPLVQLARLALTPAAILIDLAFVSPVLGERECLCAPSTLGVPCPT